MAIKTKTVFVCQNCGKQHPRWSGQCDSCGQWQTLVEEKLEPLAGGFAQKQPQPAEMVPLSQIAQNDNRVRRLSTTVAELDRVLGGEEKTLGLVPGAVVLLGGHPGVGKSTLLTQVVMGMSQTELTKNASQIKKTGILYVAGEESPEQISLRINRLFQSDQQKKSKKDLRFAWKDNLHFVVSTDVDQIGQLIKKSQPKLVVVDSIQTLTTSQLTGAAGSVGQLRAAAEILIEAAKRTHTPIFLVGHVTKEGQIAGPKVLEHMVDVVLELTGESTSDLRLVRSQKNRFGATDEVGVFQLDESGFLSLDNPSQLFLAEHVSPAAGSAITCLVEGTRPLVVEVQALASRSYLPVPRRVGRGIDTARIQVIAAVLEKHSRLPLGQQDIFANLAGGFKSKEPAIDLALAVAIVSSFKNRPLPANSIFLGEIGLLGEIRSVRFFKQRQKEAKRLGFSKQYHAQSHRTLRELLATLKLDR